MAFVLSGCVTLFLKHYDYVAPDGKDVSVGSIFLPEGAPAITQGFNPNPLPTDHSEPERGSGGHAGIDIHAEKGTPVIAPASGIVIKSYYEPFYGNHIEIDHTSDEKGRFIRSKLLHLDKRLMEKGEIVIRGDTVGTLGSTGLLAGYTHLHFEIRTINSSNRHINTPVNPHRFWFDGVGVVTCFDKDKKYPDIPYRITYPVPCRDDR